MIATDQLYSNAVEDIGYVGRIPVRNLWLLMLYASNLFRQTDRVKRTAVEENPDDIPDLVAEILTRSVERRLKRNLSFGYLATDAVLSRVRGRIDLLQTERRQLLQRGKVACRFEELTVDTPRNRFVLAALNKIAKVVRNGKLRQRCLSLANTLDRIGVSRTFTYGSPVSVDTIGRLDASDRLMVAAAHLAFDLALPTETAGLRQLSSPNREEQWIRTLFEKAVAGFYDVVLEKTKWGVQTGKRLNWPSASRTPGIGRILPSMRTDIVLDNNAAGRRIVIDTKFTAILTEGWYRKESLKSGYLYQIYAYLRSQEESEDPLWASASGLLLHPAIDERIDESVVIQGHEFRFATVNLSATAAEIRRQLLHVVREDGAFVGR